MYVSFFPIKLLILDLSLEYKALLLCTHAHVHVCKCKLQIHISTCSAFCMCVHKKPGHPGNLVMVSFVTGQLHIHVHVHVHVHCVVHEYSDTQRERQSNTTQHNTTQHNTTQHSTTWDLNFFSQQKARWDLPHTFCMCRRDALPNHLILINRWIQT